MVVEDGVRIFDLNESKYSIAGEHNPCLVHLWSAERNVVRRILDSEVREGNLRLMVQKLGQSLNCCRVEGHSWGIGERWREKVRVIFRKRRIPSGAVGVA